MAFLWDIPGVDGGAAVAALASRGGSPELGAVAVLLLAHHPQYLHRRPARQRAAVRGAHAVYFLRCVADAGTADPATV